MVEDRFVLKIKNAKVRTTKGSNKNVVRFRVIIGKNKKRAILVKDSPFVIFSLGLDLHHPAHAAHTTHAAHATVSMACVSFFFFGFFSDHSLSGQHQRSNACCILKSAA